MKLPRGWKHHFYMHKFTRDEKPLWTSACKMVTGGIKSKKGADVTCKRCLKALESKDEGIPVWHYPL
jgi:hypothetical protein